MVMSYSARTIANHAYAPAQAARGGDGATKSAPGRPNCAEAGLGPLERIALPASFGPNQAVCREGDVAAHCFKVISGHVRLCKLTDDGRRQIAAFLGAGDLFAWDESAAYRYTAEAVTHVEIAKYARAKVEDAIKAYPGLGRRLLGAITSQLAAAQNHMLLLGRKSAGERIATFLRTLAARNAERTGEGDIVMLPMSRVDIADYLGMTVETVSRMITWLKTDHVITLLETDIVRIDDHATLDALAATA